MVIVEGGRGNDLVRRIRPPVPPDVIHRGSGLVLEDLQQIPIERRRIERLLLIQMPAEYQVVVGAPVIQSLDKVPPKQLPAESKKRVAGGGGLRADVIPQGRVILHRRITILLLEIDIEVLPGPV